MRKHVCHPPAATSVGLTTPVTVNCCVWPARIVLLAGEMVMMDACAPSVVQQRTATPIHDNAFNERRTPFMRRFLSDATTKKRMREKAEGVCGVGLLQSDGEVRRHRLRRAHDHRALFAERAGNSVATAPAVQED